MFERLGPGTTKGSTRMATKLMDLISAFILSKLSVLEFTKTRMRFATIEFNLKEDRQEIFVRAKPSGFPTTPFKKKN